MPVYMFPGRKQWPQLQSALLQPTPSRCLVSLGQAPVELIDVVFLEDAQRWSQSPLSVELAFDDTQPAINRALCLSEGQTLVQRISRGSCHLLLLERGGKIAARRHWAGDFGDMDADIESQLLYMPQFAKAVVHTLHLPSLRDGTLQLSHQRLITADRVVAKRHFVAVDGCIVDNSGATVPGLAVFDTQRSELLCAAALPEGLSHSWSFGVTEQGNLLLAESKVQSDSNRFRLFGFTSNGDVDFSVKLPAVLHQPLRLRLDKDERGVVYVCEEDDEVRTFTPLEVYLRKERLDQSRLADAKERVVKNAAPCML